MPLEASRGVSASDFKKIIKKTIKQTNDKTSMQRPFLSDLRENSITRNSKKNKIRN